MTEGAERPAAGPGAGPRDGLTAPQRAFAVAAARRARLFLALSLAGVGVGAGLALWTMWRRVSDPGFPIGLRFVIVILVLLNARQNLRQYRYAKVLAALLGDARPGGTPGARVT